MANLKADGMMIFIMFFSLIIAVTFMSPIGDSIFTETNTIAVSANITVPAINGTVDLTGRTLISEISITEADNASNTSNGMFLQTGSGTNGLRTVQLTLNDTAAAFVGTLVNVTYTADPDGYVSNAGARSITSLILIFAALAALIAGAIVPLFQNEKVRRLLSGG